jgi:preprotein translocase subunit SecA
MDKLKRGISLRGYANEDPVIAYKKEGLDMFEEMTQSIQDEVVFLLLKSELKRKEKPKEQPKEDLVASGGSQDGSSRGPIVKTSTVGRNDPCPCGSGRKFKNCCGK